VISAVAAVLAAASNALASVLQRKAVHSAVASETFRLRLIWVLIPRKMWLGGIAALIAGFLFQVVALSFGSLSLVQPILVTELPFTMFLVALLFRIRLGRESWLAVGVLTAGLVVLLTAAAPAEGHRHPGRIEWAIATIVTAGVIAYLVMAARPLSGAGRAAVLGVAAGLGFSFTAALMKEVTRVLPKGPAVLLTSWPVYAMVGAGLISLFLLQLALQNTLVVVQPALNVSDPVASIAYGVGLFGEKIRLGGWSVLEILGVGLILYGSARLAASPPIRHHSDLTTPDP
jgi:drug/metabolite transporter (DMT)-like permease